MVCDGAFTFHMCIPDCKTIFFSAKIKIICQCQGQMPRSHFSKKGIKGSALAFQKQSLFYLVACQKYVSIAVFLREIRSYSTLYVNPETYSFPQIVGEDTFPEIVRPKRPQKATDEDKKEFAALFDSDSDDDKIDYSER